MVINRIDPSIEISTFRSGVQFIEFIQSHTDLVFPESIFLDIRMPEKSGFDVLDTLMELFQSKLSKTAIYILSSSLDERDLAKANSFPIVRKFMSKPLTFQVFSDLLSN